MFRLGGSGGDPDMGGEGYALRRAVSDTSLAQLKSRENRARSDLPRRSPSVIYE